MMNEIKLAINKKTERHTSTFSLYTLSLTFVVILSKSMGFYVNKIITNTYITAG